VARCAEAMASLVSPMPGRGTKRVRGDGEGGVEAHTARSLSHGHAESSGREGPSAKRSGLSGSAMDDEKRRALQAVLDSTEVFDGEELDPPAGSMTLSLLPHQRASLAWMVKREARITAGVPR